MIPDTRATLESRLSVAQARLKSVDALGEPEISSEPVDAAQVVENRSAALEDRTRLREQIGQLSRAIDRFDRKVWGRCLACGEQINRKRLAVVPEAEHCLECQRAAERPIHDSPDPDPDAA